MEVTKRVDLLWDDNPVDITQEANYYSYDNNQKARMCFKGY